MLVACDVHMDGEYGADEEEAAPSAHSALAQLHEVLGFRLKAKKAYPQSRDLSILVKVRLPDEKRVRYRGTLKTRPRSSRAR